MWLSSGAVITLLGVTAKLAQIRDEYGTRSMPKTPCRFVDEPPAQLRRLNRRT